jgi:MFS family permease
MPEASAIKTPDTPPNFCASSEEISLSPSSLPGRNWRLGFWALIVTQFQGAFSLNVLRYLLTFMVMGAALSHPHRDALVSLLTLLFFLPLVIFSMAGGFLADRFSKRQVTIATKIIEIVAMALAYRRSGYAESFAAR